MNFIQGLKRLLTLQGWWHLSKALTNKEKITFFLFALAFFGSAAYLLNSLYLNLTKEMPAFGGVYEEGMIGSPRFINPVYAASSDTDRDLTELIYSGLMKFNAQGQIIPDLAKDYKVLNNGKIYEFYLKENIIWQDGKSLTADDVLFTIKTIQDPAFKSPLRPNWLGVKADKISDTGIRFELTNPSAVFMENTTLKILPKHIWEGIAPENFLLSIYNLKPIGSGPYKFKNLSQNKEGSIQTYELISNANYAGKSPFIPKIKFSFFKNENDLIAAFKKGKIQGMALPTMSRIQELKKKESHHFSLTRYFAVFFNPGKSETLQDIKIRQALNYGTNKEELVQKVLFGNGKTVDSPVLPEIYGLNNPQSVYAYDPEISRKTFEDLGYSLNENGFFAKTSIKTPSFQFKTVLRSGSQGTEVRELQKCLAKDSEIYPEGEITGSFGEQTKQAVIRFQEKYRSEILDPSGLKNGNGEVKQATREKLNELCAAASEENIVLTFTLSTVDQPALIQAAEALKEQWQKIGVKLDIKKYDVAALENDIIRPRNYEMLLFGEVLGAIPDLFPFWHSTQVKDPGLNLTAFENKKYDKLLEDARQSMDEAVRKQSLEQFQNLLIEDSIAVFLYNPDYVHLTSKKVKGIETGVITDPAKRFAEIENWHLETKRVLK